jgi:hypothetical protein
MEGLGEGFPSHVCRKIPFFHENRAFLTFVNAQHSRMRHSSLVERDWRPIHLVNASSFCAISPQLWAVGYADRPIFALNQAFTRIGRAAALFAWRDDGTR